MKLRSVHIVIVGRVQGVGYRAWLRRQALTFGLTGWVRNCSSGEVEAVLCGEEEAVDTVLLACHQGPFTAQVELVDVLNEEAPYHEGFKILRNLQG